MILKLQQVVESFNDAGVRYIVIGG